MGGEGVGKGGAPRRQRLGLALASKMWVRPSTRHQTIWQFLERAGPCCFLFVKSEEASLALWPRASGPLPSGVCSAHGAQVGQPHPPTPTPALGRLVTSFFCVPLGHALLHKEEHFPRGGTSEGVVITGEPCGTPLRCMLPTFQDGRA